MNFFRKLTAAAAALSIVLSCSLVGFAEADDVWNRNYLAEGDEVLYESFPMMLDRSVDRDMNLKVTMEYLKNLSGEDEVTVTVKEQSSGAAVLEDQVTEGRTMLTLENLENDRLYTILVEETIGGASKQYGGVIATKYLPAEFPVDLTLGSNVIRNGNGEAFSFMQLSEVGAVRECNHTEEEECTEGCPAFEPFQKVAPEELDAFYDGLAPDRYYALGIDTHKGFDGLYTGFISTHAGEEGLGVFMPSYTFYEAEADALDSFVEPPPQPMPADLRDYYDFSTDYQYRYNYRYYQNYYGTLAPNPDGGLYFIYDWTAPSAGSYTFETIGNSDTEITTVNPSTYGRINTYTRGGTGGNVKFDAAWTSGGFHMYIIVELETGDRGEFGFRIIRNDEGIDDRTNYRDEAERQAAAGQFCDVYYEHACIDYQGDVDFYPYQVDGLDPVVRFEKVETPLSFCYYEVIGKDAAGNDIVDPFSNAEPVPTGDWEDIPVIKKNTKVVYVSVSQRTISDPSSTAYYWYDMKFYPAKHKDHYEDEADPKWGNTGVTPTQVEASFTKVDATIHYGDSDYFSFETGPDGGSYELTLDAPVDGNGQSYLYFLSMYDGLTINSVDPPSYSFGTYMGTHMTAGNKTTITVDYLQPNHRYYIGVSGSRSVYNPMYPYFLEGTFTPAALTAELSGNVTLNYDLGAPLYATTAFLDTVMASLTCKIGNVEVPDETARKEVRMYYNGEVLTAAAVKALAPGSYPITVTYKDVAITGGTVTLVVRDPSAPPQQDVAELSGISIARPIDTAEWDWLYCARRLADLRLAAEGKPGSTADDYDVLERVGSDLDFPQREATRKTLQATFLFYTNGASMTGSEFTNGTNPLNVTEESLFEKIDNGEAVIMWMADAAQPRDLDLSRYIMICGVNKTEHQLKVLNPELGTYDWIATASVMNGGYDTRNTNLKFSGYIIELAAG